MRTRIRSFIMAMLLVLSMTATTLAAGTASTAGISMLVEQAEDTITFKINLNAEYATNGRIVVTYDSEKVAFAAYETTDAWFTSVNGETAGEVSFAWVGSDMAAKEEVLTLVFEVLTEQMAIAHFKATVMELYKDGKEMAAPGELTYATSLMLNAPEEVEEEPTPEDPTPAPTPDEEVTTNPDGSTTTTVTDKDGTVTETTETKDGSTATVVTDAKGEVTEVKAEISKEAVKAETVTVPVEVEAAEDANEAVAVEITMPKVEEPVAVEIPVAEVTSGTVVILVHEDGTEEIVAATAMSENGVVIEVTGSVTVKVVDNSKDFVDDEMWAKDAINFVTARKIFNGTSENTFSPDQAMTRAMLMAVLARLDGADASGADWAAKAMAWAKANGISDGTNPDGNVTREQMVTMLYRFAGEPATNGSLAAFTDASSVSAYAVDAMKWAVENGIIGGMGDGTLAPQGTATRAQLAKILMYFINL